MKQIKFFLAELLLISGLLLVFLPALYSSFVALSGYNSSSSQKAQAVKLIEQTEEVIRIIKQNNLDEFNNNGVFHPEVYNQEWILASDYEKIGIFNRLIEVSDGDKSGVLNKRIKIIVFWGDHDQQVEKFFYLSDI